MSRYNKEKRAYNCCYSLYQITATTIKTIFFIDKIFFIILVKREHALTSGTIKAMLSGPGQFAENEANEVNFREIPSHVLQKVCMYFTYKVRYTNSSTEIPEFPIAPEIALELLMAANFLDC